MMFYALPGKVLFPLFIFSFLMFEAIAFDDECISFYSFENELDTPDIKGNFSDNGGWRFDEISKSFESGNQSKTISSFWTTREGPLDINFEWKISSTDRGIGILQFQIDGKPSNQSNKCNWTKVSVRVPKGTHELKWIVQNGPSQPFTGWIDSLCIRNHSCPKTCPSTIISNQPPILKNFTSSVLGSQEVGASIIWVAEAYDYENDPILFKFFLNDLPMRDWSSNKSWNWKTEDFNLGSNKIEVRIRDGKHAGPESYDDRRSSDFTLIAPNKKPMIINFSADKKSPINLHTPITWTVDTHDRENDHILYKFFLNGSAINDWNPENVWTWTANQTGISQIEVWIRDEKHAGPESADDKQFASFGIGVPNQKPSILSLSPNKESPSEAGTFLTWTAMASDPEYDQILYKFILNGQTVQDWSLNNIWNWDTGRVGEGDYKIEVWIIDEMHSDFLGADDKEEAKYCLIEQIELNEPPVLNDLKPDKLSPQEAGVTITWTAEASDPDNDLISYKFRLNGADETGWSANNSWGWTTTEDDARINLIEVWVIDNKHAGINGTDDQIAGSFVIGNFVIGNNCYINNLKIVSPDEVCSGSVNKASVPYDKNNSYSWKIINGDIISGRNEHRITWVAGSSSYVTLEVTMSNEHCEPLSAKKELKINLIDSPNNIKYISPTNDLNLTEFINECDCKTIRLGRGNYSGPIMIKKNNIK
jgi:hypothetical protein